MIHASFHSWWCLMNWKVKLFKQEVFLSEQCTVSKNLQQVFEVQSFGLDTVPQSFCRSFIALLIIRRSKSAQKFAVRVCRVTIVVMETTQLVLSQFKNFSSHQLRIESCLSLYKKKSLVNCELVKLCHINCSGPFVWERHCILAMTHEGALIGWRPVVADTERDLSGTAESLAIRALLCTHAHVAQVLRRWFQLFGYADVLRRNG